MPNLSSTELNFDRICYKWDHTWYLSIKLNWELYKFSNALVTGPTDPDWAKLSLKIQDFFYLDQIKFDLEEFDF